MWADAVAGDEATFVVVAREGLEDKRERWNVR